MRRDLRVVDEYRVDKGWDTDCDIFHEPGAPWFACAHRAAVPSDDHQEGRRRVPPLAYLARCYLHGRDPLVQSAVNGLSGSVDSGLS